MAVTTSPFFGIQYGWETGDAGWGDPVNTNLKVMSFLDKGAVDDFVSSLPGSPVTGSSYVLTTDNLIYVRFTEGWVFITPQLGMEVTKLSDGTKWKWNGSAWVETLSEVSLKNSSDPTKGASLVGYQNRTVGEHIGDKYVLRNGATVSDLIAGINTGLEVVIPTGVDISIDNSSGVGLTISADNVRITGSGSITALSDANPMIEASGTNFYIEGITLQGPGTYRVDLGSTGNAPALLKCSGDDAYVTNCTFINPFGAGVTIYASAGSKVTFNKFTSGYVGSIAQPFLFHIYLRVCSDTIVYGNTLVGSIQGICGGGDGNLVITVVKKDGITTSDLSNTTIQGNTCVNQLDHSIYISNNSTNTTIDNNYVESANDLIKIENGPNIVTNNRGIGGSGITGRNIRNSTISGNIMTTTLSSTTAYGILLYEQIFQRPLNDVTISNNTMTCTGSISAGGIYVLGDVWSGYQSVISNLKIIGNTLTGYGNTSEGFGIQVSQKLFSTNPVTGNFGTNIIVSNNVINFPAHSQPTYGILLNYGLKNGSVTGNIINNFRSMGIRALGVQDFEYSGNTLIVDPTAVTTYGFYERPKDTTLHYDSLNNRYTANRYAGTTLSRTVQHSDESCFNADRSVVRNTSVISSDTILAARWTYIQVYNNHNAGAVITLENNASSPWPVNREITIVNAGASNSLTVNPGGYAVAAGTSIRLVCTGSNAFIKAN